jgi:hypothetical protein
VSGPFTVITDCLDPGTDREESLPELDRKPDPWESRMQATCECLSWRGTLDNLERRQIEDELGETTYADFPVRSRSVIATAHTLLERGVFDEDELRSRMEAIRERMDRR